MDICSPVGDTSRSAVVVDRRDTDVMHYTSHYLVAESFTFRQETFHLIQDSKNTERPNHQVNDEDDSFLLASRTSSRFGGGPHARYFGTLSWSEMPTIHRALRILCSSIASVPSSFRSFFGNLIQNGYKVDLDFPGQVLWRFKDLTPMYLHNQYS